MEKELQVGEHITIGDAQYVAVKAVASSCAGCAFHNYNKFCGQSDEIIYTCISNDIIFQAVKQ